MRHATRLSSNILASGVLSLAAIAASAPSSRAGDSPASAEAIEFFESRIRPVLAEHCFQCHSAKAESPKANLRLDAAELMRKGGDSGPPITAGKPADSLLISAIKYESLEMPPKGKLPDAVIADFEQWIAMGAP